VDHVASCRRRKFLGPLSSFSLICLAEVIPVHLDCGLRHTKDVRRCNPVEYTGMLAVALAEARKGLDEGGIPIGAAIFDAGGHLIGAGHNRRVQNGDPSLHGETDAFRNAGRQRSYRNLIMVTTLAPCWYCSGLVRQFGFRTLVVGESRNFQGGVDWLRSLGVNVVDLDSGECAGLLANYIAANPEVWNEDIGEE